MKDLTSLDDVHFISYCCCNPRPICPPHDLYFQASASQLSVLKVREKSMTALALNSFCLGCPVLANPFFRKNQSEVERHDWDDARWRQRRWLLLPNRPLLAGDEVLPQDMSTCTLRTTSSSSCFSMLCPVVHGSFIYLRVLCLCPGRPFPNPPAPYCGSACLSRPFLSGTIVSFIGKNTQMAYLVQVCRWSPNLRKFLPFLGRQ